MVRRSPAEARALGLWTAGCLALLLVLGLSWVGDWALQWPVLVVPAGWAVLALMRGRRRRSSDVRRGSVPSQPDGWDEPDREAWDASDHGSWDQSDHESDHEPDREAWGGVDPRHAAEREPRTREVSWLPPVSGRPQRRREE